MVDALVLVRWTDSAFGSAEWQYVENLEEPPNVECESVGWLVKKNDRVVQLAASKGGAGGSQVAGVTTIVAKCVDEIILTLPI